MTTIQTDARFLLSPDTLIAQEWPTYRFLMPTLSVGQVGQLSVDLLLNNFRDEVCTLGIIYSDAVLSVTGIDRTGTHLVSALELFICESHKLVILQQRSPFVKGRIPTFRRKLLAWVKQAGFTEMLVLAGVSSHIRKDAELGGSLFRFLTSNNEVREKLLKELTWREYVITKQVESLTGLSTCTTAGVEGTKTLALPGSGILKSLYEDCIEEDISFAAFLVFCNPGNTIHEAIQLVEHLRQFLGISGNVGLSAGKDLRMPVSWNPPSDEVKSNYIF